jgi:hypothetical protein
MSRTRIALVGALVAALTAVSAVSAVAAPPSSDTQSQTVKFTNRASVQLTLDTPSVDFGAVDPLAQYAAGGGNANVKANAAWTLTMSAPTNFTESGTGTNVIPIGRLSLSAGGGAYNTVVAAPSTNAVSTGAKTGVGGVNTSLAYHLQLQFSDDPNTGAQNYQAVLQYTATTP